MSLLPAFKITALYQPDIQSHGKFDFVFVTRSYATAEDMYIEVLTPQLLGDTQKSYTLSDQELYIVEGD
jgi:hypothetical protein